MKKISVMIVEDSLVVSEFLRAIIDRDPRLQVAAVVRSGEEALACLAEIKPDVISLDIRLPGMNGLETTKRIMSTQPTPIVVVSSDVENEELQISMNALRAGALAVVQKPVGLSHEDYDALAGTLCTKLTIMSQVRVIRQRLSTASFTPSLPAIPVSQAEARPAIVGIVASTGGPSAVVKVLGDLHAAFSLPILLVQHITPGFVSGFVHWLDDVLPHRRVVEAEHGVVMEPGTVYVAPAGSHLTCALGGRIALVDSPAVAGQKPSGTVLFESMARIYGRNAVGVLLTGMGEDGAFGLRDMYHKGAYTIAEHESTTVVNGMPGAAVRLGVTTDVLPLDEIGPRLNKFPSRQTA